MTAVALPSASTLLPAVVRSTPVGLGTVQSEVDRSIRVRIDGTGPASQRQLVPDSAAAAALFASPHAPALERGLRAILAPADAHAGTDNLRSITLLPDEHASKAVIVLNDAAHRIDRGERPRDTENAAGALARVREMTQYEDEDVAFAGARNLGGHVVLMPDVSRNLLTTLGLYRQQDADAAQATRDPAATARWSWHAALHEVQHSISPRTKGDRVEATRIMEESIAEVLTPQQITPALRASGGAVARMRDVRADDGDAAGAVDWEPWNRDHIFEAMDAAAADTDAAGAHAHADLNAATAQSARRYVDGPALVRELTQLAGIDRRTTDGRAAATELLQGREASHAPRRIADAIVAHHGGSTNDARELAQLIRTTAVGTSSMSDVRRAVRDLQPRTIR